VFDFYFCLFNMHRRTLSMMIYMTSSPQLRRRLRLVKMSIPDSIYHITSLNAFSSCTKTLNICFHLIHLLFLRLLKLREWVNVDGKNMPQYSILFHWLCPSSRLLSILFILFKQLQQRIDLNNCERESYRVDCISKVN
jgi:hypothetical protein